MPIPANFGAGLFPEDESAPSFKNQPVPMTPPHSSTPDGGETARQAEPAEGGFSDRHDSASAHGAPSSAATPDWGLQLPVSNEPEPAPNADLFGDVVPIDDSVEAKAAALRSHRREATESRGVEPLDDHVHGAEIPTREAEDNDRRRRRGGRRSREEGPRRGGRHDRGDNRRNEPMGEPAPMQGGGGFQPRGRGGRNMPRSFEAPIPEMLIEQAPPAAPAYGGMSHAPSYNSPPSYSLGSQSMPYGTPPSPPASNYGNSGYGAPPAGEVGGLRREIEELRAQLQRSIPSGGGSSIYGESPMVSRAPMQAPAPMLMAVPAAAAPPTPAPSMALFAAQRVAIVADVPSLQRTAKKHFGRVVSFSKLLSSVLRGRGAVRAMAFLAERDASDPAFMSHLRGSGFEVRRLDMGSDSIRRSDVASSLPLEATRLANRVDCLVLAGCDSELLAIIPALRAQGCRVELASFPDAAPEAARDSADAYLALGREELI